MREIKFRGLSVDNGKWVYGYYCYNSSFNEHWIQYKHQETHPMDISVSIIPETLEVLCDNGEFKSINDIKIS